MKVKQHTKKTRIEYAMKRNGVSDTCFFVLRSGFGAMEDDDSRRNK